jgi:NADH-quinone oxidoreductase subunit L
MNSGSAVAGESAAAPEQESAAAHTTEVNTGTELGLMAASVGVAILGFFFAWLFYFKRPDLPDKITSKVHGLYMMVLHKYYVDEGYGAIFVKPLLALSTVVLWRGVDQGVIDGLVNGAGSASQGVGGELRRMQSGNIRSYAAWVAIGAAAILGYMIWLGVSK